MTTTTLAVAGWLLLACSGGLAADVTLLSTASNDLVPRIFNLVPATRSENVVFSSLGLLQNLAVLAELTSNADVKNEIARLANLTGVSGLETVKRQFQTVLTTFELESEEGENSTSAAGLFNYLHTNREHRLSRHVEDALVLKFRTNVSVDTSLEGGWFTASADTGVLSHWHELEALAVFTFLQHSAAAPFTLNNGTIRTVPLVPQIGRFETRETEHYLLVKLPLQAQSSRLVLVLPKSPADFAQLVSAMPPMHELLTGGEARQLEVWIPQLLAISSVEFKPILQQLGVRAVFSADFSHVTGSSDPLRLAGISQKSFFSTSFNSIKSITESAARLTATEVGKRRRRREAGEAAPLVFNRPFLFFIERTDLQGVVLTAGCVNDPTQFPQQF